MAKTKIDKQATAYAEARASIAKRYSGNYQPHPTAHRTEAIKALNAKTPTDVIRAAGFSPNS